jgi:hypothetical protein
VVGSWWPQAEREADLQRLHRGKVSDEERETILSGSAQKAISQQMALGLTEWTGGEYFTDEFLNHMQKVLTGIEIDVPSKPILFDYDDFAHAKITGQINAPNGMGYLTGFLREKAAWRRSKGNRGRPLGNGVQRHGSVSTADGAAAQSHCRGQCGDTWISGGRLSKYSTRCPNVRHVDDDECSDR